MPSPPAGPDGPPTEDDRRGLRERTALLSSFAAAGLARADDDGTRAAALQDFLLEECTRTTTSHGRRWSLAPAPRARTLDGLRTRDRLLAAAESAPGGTEDPACAWAVRLLRRDLAPLGEQSFDELYTALSVVGWFRDAPRARDALARDGVALPHREEIERALGRARLLQPLHALAGPRFAGRTRELSWLSARLDDGPYGGPPAPRRSGAARVFVHGPGGVGKSTLVARFVLDRTDGPTRSGATHEDALRQGTPQPAPPPAAMPCLYLTFDRHDLVAERPLTLVAEAVRQLGLLHPRLAARTADLERELSHTLTADRLTRSEEGRLGPRAAHRRDELTLIDAFAALVTSVTGGTTRPWLLALDAFEQVQRTGPVAVERLLDLLTRLHQAHPGLRVLAAGRAPVESAAFESLRLDGLDHDTALSFLQRELTDEAGDTAAAPGAERRRELADIMSTVGTSPLELKIAAAAVRRRGIHVLDDPRLRNELRLALNAERVQGVLYLRILDHLDDPDLRAIASPGLVVRTLTPDVIREVLAEPCGLGHVDEARARRLFDELRAEATLVEPMPGRDAVVHRADVRRVMLELVRRDRPEVVDRIHRRAVRYYALLDAEDDPVESRTEELYHRLALGQPTRTLDGRWTDAAGSRLESAMDELPACAQVYLTEKLGNSATAALRGQADDETWERQALRLGRSQLAADQPAEAVRVLSERPHLVARNLALVLLRMRAGLALRRPADAYARVERALELAAESGDPGTFVELALLGARACEDLGRFGDAVDLLAQARRVGSRHGMAIRLLSVSAARLRIHRRCGTEDTEEARELRRDTVRRVDGLDARSCRRHPLLIRELAAEIGDEMPELVSYTATSLGVGGSEGPDDALLGTLTGEVVNTPRPVPADEARGPSGPAGPDGPGESAEPVGPARPAVRGDGDGGEVFPGSVNVSSVSRGIAVGDYLGERPAAFDAWRRTLVHSFRHEVDRPYTGDAVVVVPGFAGSTLVDEETGETVWMSGLNMLLGRGLRFRGVDRLAVTEAQLRGEPGLRPGRLLSLPAWVPLVGGLSPYSALVDCVGEATLHDEAVLQFPYDWRLSAESNARVLAEAAARHLRRWTYHPARLASAYREPADEPKLVIVAHSTGGLVAQSALAQSPELARETRDVVAIGTPFQGVPQSLSLFGPRPGHRKDPGSHAAHAVVRTMPGVYDLLPDAPCVVTADGGLRRLTPDDVAAVGGVAEFAEAALAARRRTATARQPRLHAVVGTSQPTVQSVAVAGGAAEVFRNVPRLGPDGTPVRDGAGHPVTVDEDGDGLVPTWSAMPPPHARYLPVVGRHGSLPSSTTVVNLVREILTSASGGPNPPGAEIRGSIAVRDRLPGRMAPDQDTGPAPSFGISAPSEVAPGREWSLTVTGAHHTAVACRLLRAETGEVAARLLPEPVAGVPGTSTARAKVDRPGLYTVLAQAGGLSATALVVVVDEGSDS